MDQVNDQQRSRHPHKYLLASGAGPGRPSSPSTRAVEGFLAPICSSVPDGAEFLASGLDAELDGILGGAA